MIEKKNKDQVEDKEAGQIEVILTCNSITKSVTCDASKDKEFIIYSSKIKKVALNENQDNANKEQNDSTPQEDQITKVKEDNTDIPMKTIDQGGLDTLQQSNEEHKNATN